MKIKSPTQSNTLPLLILWFAMICAVPLAARAQDSAAAVVKVDTSKAYIVADSTFLTVNDDGSMTERIVRIIRVLAAEGSRYTGIEIEDDKTVDVKSVLAYQIDKGGKAVDTISGTEQMLRTCGFGAEFALYSDECSWHGGFERIATPYTVVWDYTVRFGTASYYYGIQPEGPLWIQNAYIEVKNAPATNLLYRLRGNMPEPATTTENGCTVWRWSFLGLPKADLEDHLPWRTSYLKTVLLTPTKFKFAGKNFDGTSWATLSRDYYELIKDNFRTINAQNKLIAEAVASGGANSLAVLHDKVCRKMRYVAIYFGFGGWVPHRSDETFTVGYGDCKDLSTMYASMLHKAGVAANLALIATRNSFLTEPDLPKLIGFNHVILFMPNGPDTTWIDATCLDCALGDLPAAVEDVYTLAIDPVNGGLVQTPASRPEDNIIVRSATLTVNDDLSASAELHFDLKGNPAHGLHQALNATEPTRMADWVRRALGFSGNFQVQPPGVEVVARELSRLRLRVTAKIPRVGSAAGSSEVIDLGFIQLFDDAEQHDLRGRTVPLDVGSPETVIDSILIRLPAGHSVKTLPPELNLDSAFGSLVTKVSQSDNLITIERRRTRSRYEIGAAELSAFAAYRDEATLKARLTISLTKP